MQAIGSFFGYLPVIDINSFFFELGITLYFSVSQVGYLAVIATAFTDTEANMARYYLDQKA